MNYYQARKRESDGRWDFTCRNDDRIWPVGYCHEYRPFTGNERWMVGGAEHAAKENAKEEPFRSKYHVDGHATAGEAANCYRRYVLDHRTHLREEYPHTKLECVVCKEWTTLRASVDHGRSWPLCELHNNQDEVERLYPASSEIVSSY